MEPGGRSPEDIIEEVVSSDEALDSEELVTGTELYEDIDEDDEQYEDDPAELDFEPDTFAQDHIEDYEF